MTNESPAPDAVTFFLQHCVGINLRLKLPDGSEQADLYSCFVIEMKGQWFLVTAGHILVRIYRELLPVCAVLECSLFDGWRANAAKLPIPLNLADTEHFEADDDGIDVGFLRLDDHHRRLLSANGIRAFDETAWRGNLDTMTVFRVLGFPTQFIETVRQGSSIDSVNVRPIFLRLERVSEPEQMKRDFPRFYGQHASVLRSEEGGDLHELDGLSGGPIFGFRPTPDGLKYHLVAIQSAWHRELRIVTGPLFAPVAVALADFLAAAHG